MSTSVFDRASAKEICPGIAGKKSVLRPSVGNRRKDFAGSKTSFSSSDTSMPYSLKASIILLKLVSVGLYRKSISAVLRVNQ